MVSANDKIQDAVKETVEEIDKTYLRRMEAEMHRCAAACCEDRHSSFESVRHCVESCGETIKQAQAYMQREFVHFQDRMNRCHMACSDQIRDKLSANPTETEIHKYRSELDACANKCAETHIGVVKLMRQQMKEAFSSNSFQSRLA